MIEAELDENCTEWGWWPIKRQARSQPSLNSGLPLSTHSLRVLGDDKVEGFAKWVGESVANMMVLGRQERDSILSCLEDLLLGPSDPLESWL